MKKRLIAVGLMLGMALSLAACNKPATPSTPGTESTENNSQEVVTPDTPETEEVLGEVTEYKVTLVDANGKPVAGQMIQVCNDTTYFPPAVTDFDGVAVFSLAQSNKYKAKLMTAPDSAYVAFEVGKTELTLKLAE